MENFGNFMQQTKKLQEAFKHVQQELTTLRVTGISGIPEEGVQFEMNGQYEVISCRIDEPLMQVGKKVLEELVQAAANDAIAKVKRAQKEKMGGVMSGFGMPFGMNLPFMSGDA